MFLNLKHESLDVYTTARKFVHCCYRHSRTLPPDERFAMSQQLRRAALSVHLNIAEGSSRRSEAERKRFYEISRSSLTEIDAILDIAVDLEYFRKEELAELGALMVRTFTMLSRMI